MGSIWVHIFVPITELLKISQKGLLWIYVFVPLGSTFLYLSQNRLKFPQMGSL